MLERGDGLPGGLGGPGAKVRGLTKLAIVARADLTLVCMFRLIGPCPLGLSPIRVTSEIQPIGRGQIPSIAAI